MRNIFQRLQRDGFIKNEIKLMRHLNIYCSSVCNYWIALDLELIHSFVIRFENIQLSVPFIRWLFFVIVSYEYEPAEALLSRSLKIHFVVTNLPV